MDGRRELLEHAGWVRALARRLVRDVHLADDLAQEAAVVALQSPAAARDPRAWLGGIVRNLARELRRAEGRRVERERRAARREAVEDAPSVLERAELHRRLVEAVLRLREPSRTALLLRFLDGLPPRRIAARLGVPVATVRSRIRRGLEELRAELDSEHGGRSGAWLAVALPLAGPGWSAGAPLAPSTAIGAALMDAKLKLAAATALLACGAAAVYHATRAPGAPPQQEVAAVEVAAPLRASPGAAPTAIEAQAERAVPAIAAPAAPSAPPEEQAAPSLAAPVRGRVLGSGGAALVGVRVAFVPTGSAEAVASAPSGAGGTFELAPQERAGSLRGDDPRLVTVLAGTWRPGSTLEPVVVLAPRAPLAGRVVDEDGRPLEGARLELAPGPAFGARFAAVLDASNPVELGALSDAQGRFELPDAPGLEGQRLTCALEGFQPLAVEPHTAGDLALELVLRREQHGDAALRGEVVGPDGRPLPGATVGLDLQTAVADARGRFAFPAESAAEARRLSAAHPGFRPAVLEAREGDGGAGRWPAFARLQLAGEGLVLSGRVVDEDGGPVSGAKVWLADPTLLGIQDGMPLHAEGLAAGAPALPELRAGLELAPAGTDREAWLRARPNAMWPFVTTDAEGRFELRGLLPRSYRLLALDEATLAQVEAGPFEPGEAGLRLVLPYSALHARVRGRVLGRDGAPIAGVKVACVRTVVRVEYAIEGGHLRSTRSATGAEASTGEDGGFELERVPKEGVFLALTGDAILPDFRLLEPGDDVDDLEVRVARRCHLQVELGPDSPPARQVQVLDAGGDWLPLCVIRGEDEQSSSAVTLVDGRTQVLAVSEEAATLVLLADGQELARMPIALLPGGVNVLRP